MVSLRDYLNTCHHVVATARNLPPNMLEPPKNSPKTTLLTTLPRLMPQNTRKFPKDSVSKVSQLFTSLSKILSLIVSFIFNRKGEKTEYTGGRTEQDIVNWILKKVGPPSNEVTAEQLKTKVDENKLVVVYFGDVEAKEYKDVFLEVATNPSVGDKYQFFHINDEATAKSYGATKLPAIVLFRKFDESPLVYSGSYETTPVVDFLVSSSVPTLIDFSEDYIEPIFGQRKAALFLFRDPEDSNADFVKTFSEAASKLKGEILFVVSGIKDGIQNRLSEFVGVDASSLPTIRILNPQDNMRKYTFPGDVKGLKLDEVKQFVQDFKEKKLVAALKSQEIPETNDEPVKILVGKNFKDFVGKDSDVLVEFYAPWCGHCKKLAPLYDELATELKEVKNLVIAKMDSTVNEVEGIDIRGYPTIKFFPAGSDKGIDYEGDRDVAGFKKYLSEKSTTYKKHLESASAAKEGEL